MSVDVSNFQMVALDSIIFDSETQPRTAIVPETVDEYRVSLDGGATLPPVDLFFDGSQHWIGDGFHRVLAFRAAERSEVPAIVHEGGKREAILHAVGANDAHGMRRTNADKRRSVEIMLRDEEWREWSNVAIAERCKVDQSTVSRIRSEMHPTLEKQKSQPRKGRDGRTTNTANIGKTKPKPAPEPDPAIIDSLELSKPITNGKARVNGVEAPDPPDVAALRKAGAIPKDVVVEIDEPEPEPIPDEPEDSPDLESEGEVHPSEPTDDEWLESLPLSSVLTGSTLRVFRRDALLYRRMEQARKTYQHHFRRESKALARKNHGVLVGEYEQRMGRWLRLEHPKDWKRCPPPEHGGCDGNGGVEFISECPKCHRRGYLVF